LAETKFIIFYVAFLVLILTVSAFIPIEFIEGLTVEQIEILSANVVLPEEPTIIDYLVYPFLFIHSVVTKMLILLLASTSHQLIAIVLTPFTIAFLYIMAKLIRGGG